MNWETAAAIAQVVGAVAIILTLVYLAVQIRQANRAALTTGYYQTTEQWQRWSELMVTTPDLPGIILRGNRSLRDLTAEEALRYGNYAQMFFDIVENYLRLTRQLGLASEEKVLREIVGRRLTPGMAEWWLENRVDYSPDMVSWVEPLIGRATSQ